MSSTTLIWTPYGSLKVSWPPGLPLGNRLELANRIDALVRDFGRMRAEHWYLCRTCNHFNQFDHGAARCHACDGREHALVADVLILRGYLVRVEAAA